MKSAGQELLEGCLGYILIWGLIFGGFYFSVKSAQEDARNSSANASVQTRSKDIDADPSEDEREQVEELVNRYEESYVNPEWPTTDSELLAVPDENRWYFSYFHIGETHTVVGPVVRVYQALDEEGQPIFIDIGNEYPAAKRFTVVVWAQDLDNGFREMVESVDDGNAWLSITGYISSYDDVPQMSSGDGPMEFTWYTNVK